MISVIGAGPAGSIAARSCSQEDDTVLYDAQDRSRRRVQCSGLISKTGLQRLGISPSKVSLNTVRGAKIFSPSGKLLEIGGKKEKAFVVDRRKFDNLLLDEAIDGGVKFVNKHAGREEIARIKKESRKLVIATGTDYNMHRLLSLNAPREFLYGAQYELKVECDRDFVEMHLDVPGFFSWIIPAGDTARVGLCTVKNPVPYLDRFVGELRSAGRLKEDKAYDRNYGVIPMYDPKLRTQYPGIVLVGDAAGQVKATSGGGIVMGCLAAGLVFHDDYEKRWKKLIGRELYLHLKIRRALDRLSDKNLDRLILLLRENKGVIEEKGDMDMASGLAKNLLINPVFMAKLIMRMPGFLLDLA